MKAHKLITGIATLVQRRRSLLMITGAFGAFVGAAFMWCDIAGVVMIGVSLVALDYLAE
jgi:hypothetical protein